MAITINIYYTGKMEMHENLQKIINLREKYDLSMNVERYTSDEAGIPEKDKVFIKE